MFCIFIILKLLLIFFMYIYCFFLFFQYYIIIYDFREIFKFKLLNCEKYIFYVKFLKL